MKSVNIKRRHLSALLALVPVAGRALAQSGKPVVEVWKSPSCGCCNKWISYLEANGFTVKSHDSGNSAVRAKAGVKSQYGSCHTALVDGYAVEGHVPAREILRMLKDRPDAIGIAVPRMPLGSPGMDGPDHDNETEPYAVLLLARNGEATIYQTYP